MTGPGATGARQGLVWNAGALLGGRLVRAGLGWAATVLIVRGLSVEEFGRFALVFTVLGLTSVLTDLGIGRLAVRHLHDHPLDARFAGAYLGLRCALGVAGYAAGVAFVALARYPAEVVAATAVAGVVVLLATPSSGLQVIFQARMRLGPVAAAETLGALALVALTAAIAAAGGTVLLFTLPAIALEVVVLARKAVLVRRELPVRPLVDLPLWGAMLREALPLTLGLAVGTLYARVDALMLSKLAGFHAVAVYGVSYKFIDVLHFASTAVTVPLLTLLVRHWPDDLPAFRYELRRAAVLLALAGGGALVVLLGFAAPVTHVLYGEDYRAGAVTTGVLAVAQMATFAVSLASCVLVAAGRPGRLPHVMLLGLAANVALNVVAIPRWSYLGAGVATLASDVVVVVLAWALVRRETGLVPRGLGRPLAAVALGTAASLAVGLATSSVVGWVGGLLAGLATYAVVVTLSGPVGIAFRGATHDGGVRDGGPRLAVVAGTGQVSGAERVLLDVVGAARDDGWEIECAVPAGPLADELRQRGALVVPVPELGRAAGPLPWALAVTAARWGRAAALTRTTSRGSDVVLVNSRAGLPVVRLARPHAPVVWLAHDVLVRADRRALYAVSRRALARVIAVSEAVAGALPPGGPPVDVVHNGVAWPPPDGPATRDEHRPVVGLNGVLSPWKGQRVLLAAAARLPEDTVVELVGGCLAGDRDYALELRALVAEGGLADRVRIVGHVEDPLARMRGWTVAVSASTEPEACPLNVLEAMSLGVPVVATDHGGAPEVLDGAGLLVPPGDPDALAAAVTRLLEDPGLRERLAARGRDRVAARHRRDHQVAALLAVLRSVAGLAPGATQEPRAPQEVR